MISPLCQHVNIQIHLPHLHEQLLYLWPTAPLRVLPSVSPSLHVSEHHVHFLPITCLPLQPASHSQSVLPTNLALSAFSHFTGFKSFLFLPPSDISKTQWKITSSGLSHPLFQANTYLYFSHYDHTDAFNLLPLSPRGAATISSSSCLCNPYPLMPSLPKEHFLCFSMLSPWDRCLLCVWKSTCHAVGINRQVTKDLSSRLQQGWHRAATGRLP